MTRLAVCASRGRVRSRDTQELGDYFFFLLFPLATKHRAYSMGLDFEISMELEKSIFL